jgi:hypothetical protein
MPWKAVGYSAVTHIPSSAKQYGKDVVRPFTQPKETARQMKNLVLGVAEKAGISSGETHKAYADAAGQFFIDRYGSVENFKRTLATDPVGVLADISLVLSGGGALLARAPGAVGTLGRAVGTVGRVSDPLSAVGKAVKGTGALAAEGLGYTTGKGGEAIRGTARAGFEDIGPVQRMPAASIVKQAHANLADMQKARGKAYEASEAIWKADTTVQDFSKIRKAVVDTFKIKTFKDRSLSPSTQKIRNKIDAAVTQWGQLNPSEYHTLEGLDALKQSIGDIRDATERGTPDRLITDKVYHAIRDTIATQSPEYAKAMTAYEKASADIKAVQKALGKKGTPVSDTLVLSRLQKVLGENAHLVTPGMLEKLAGQSLAAWSPKGLGKFVGMEVLGSVLGGSTGALGVMALLPFASPRLTGEVAYYAGRAGRGLSKLPLRPVARGAFQQGRKDPQFKAAEKEEEERRAQRRVAGAYITGQ